MNVYDSVLMENIVKPLGFNVVSDAEQADLVILNTCHIREKAAEKLYSELGRIHSSRKEMTIVVAGCVAQAEGEEVFRRAPFVDIVVGPQSIAALPELIVKASRSKGHVINTDFPEVAKFDKLPDECYGNSQGSSAFLSIQEGCDKFCTFCVVPYTRGAEYSRPVNEIFREVLKLVANGANEINLLGQNVNAYHGECEGEVWDLGKLISHIAKIEKLERIRYTTSHPRDMHESLYLAHTEEPKLMPFVHLPVQSGSNKILRVMNRKHTAEEYLEIIDRFRKLKPEIEFSSDFIVGFPGETEKDFEETMKLVEKVKYAQAYSFKYSPRPGTPGAERKDQVPEEVKTERLLRLQKLISKQQLELNQSMVGKTIPALFSDKKGKHQNQIIGKSPYMQSVCIDDPEVSSPDFSLLEKEIIKFCQENKVFERSVEKRSKDNCFVFYDGPPFANGLPHYGHLLTGFIKDAFARYQTMLQKRVERRFDWDCHGLPAEMGAEKELGISGRTEIEKFGIEKFNNHCRTSVMKFSSEWEKYVNRQARWVDFHNDYKTMDKSFMESVMWAFEQLYDKGLVYESVRVVPYSWACETPLSNFETRLDNAYREKTSKAVTVAFELLENPQQFKNVCKLLAWTTTPWTLPSNLTLAIGKDIEYCAVLVNGEIHIFAESYLEKFISHSEQNNIPYENCNIKLKANDLVGLSYKPLFDYFKDTKNAFRVFIADYVTGEDGTGVVHTAPGFGEEDFYLCQSHDIPVICPIDNSGKFTAEVSDLAGVHVFATNDTVIKKLKGQGSWFKTEQYIHNYPHCWRTDTPLVYRTMPSWYVAVTKFKSRMVELNKRVNWITTIKMVNLENGLKGHTIVNFTQSILGISIPVWKSDEQDIQSRCIRFNKRSRGDFNVKIDDLHRPFIDTLRPTPDRSNRKIDYASCA
ncbi:hypothetical protein FQR65_LT19236 [Abscondita terminalis]|nr:hypothetical protein FQR65_LT19236 [Abscondita terminalis]